MAFDLQPTLRGELVELRPLTADDWDALYAVACDPLIWEQHPEPERWRPDVFRRFFQGALDSGGAFLVLDRESQQVIGSTRYFGYNEARSEIEIGWTFLARSHWGGRYNGDMKRLMLRHAFQFVTRVLFLIGPNNLRSQKAVERIGGTRSESRPARDIGDSVVFAIDRATYTLRDEARATS